MLVGLRGSGNFSLRSETIRNGKDHVLQGLFPPAPWATPRAGTSSEVPQPGTSSSSFSRPSGGQDKRGGGGLRVHLVLCPGRLPPLPLDLGLARGGGECLWTFVHCARARLCLFSPFGSWGWGGCSVATDSPCPCASSVASPRSSQHALRRGESREVSEDRSLARSSRVSRSSDRGTRKDCRARSRSDSSRDRGRRSRFRSSYRPRSSGRERQRRSSSRSLSSRERSRSSDRYRSRRDRSRSSDRYRSWRQRASSPARREARCQAIFLVVLVTARGLVDDHLPPLTVRGQRREDGEPDVSSRRVWRR